MRNATMRCIVSTENSDKIEEIINKKLKLRKKMQHKTLKTDLIFFFKFCVFRCIYK